MDGGVHNLDYFRERHLLLPSLDEETSQADQPESHKLLTGLVVDATMKYIQSTQSLLDAFTSWSPSTLRMIPNVLCVPAAYSTMVLLKVSHSVSSTGLGELISFESLKIDYYLDRVLGRLTEAAGSQQYRVPTHWLQIATKLRVWHAKHKMNLQQKQNHASLQNHSPPALQDSGIPSSQSFQWSIGSDALGAFDGQSFQTPRSDGASTSSASFSLLDTGVMSNTNSGYSSSMQAPTSASQHSNLMSLPDFPMDFSSGNIFSMDFADVGLGDLSSWMPDSSMLADFNYGLMPPEESLDRG